ncbi:nucleotidyltransferase family protein [Hydrogenophaga sp.]|uniref:nucleotidyltransferase family protein n=1 Tax=Hydrogenophaga sp. TaxID=1904254 RepID=UPI002619CAD6|nr:nucleotidyltransferase family protein [Hydrogenophaga sp.]MDM7949526.1 nucleotidyltransferase family protein [Hydrogenophaga sp.]
MNARLGVLILAAGAGSRMGDLPKCLIRVDGEPLLMRLLRALDCLPVQHTVLVLGHHASRIQKALAQCPSPSGVSVAHNPAPGEDPASSLQLGLCRLLEGPADPAIDAVMVLLADLPLLNGQDLRSVCDAFTDSARKPAILWPSVQGQPGHPVILRRDVAQAVLRQGQGLKPWRAQHPEQITDWPTDNDHHVRDLDTLADLDKLRRLTGRTWQLPESDT